MKIQINRVYSANNHTILKEKVTKIVYKTNSAVVFISNFAIYVFKFFLQDTNYIENHNQNNRWNN